MQLSNKTFLFILAITIALASIAAYIKISYSQNENEIIETKVLRLKTTEPNLPQIKENKICSQVITRAINPETGQEQDFPTPCDVPQGWQTIK
jgi:hypothetical protein